MPPDQAACASIASRAVRDPPHPHLSILSSPICHGPAPASGLCNSGHRRRRPCRSRQTEASPRNGRRRTTGLWRAAAVGGQIHGVRRTYESRQDWDGKMRARLPADFSASATRRDGAGVFTAEDDNQVEVEVEEDRRRDCEHLDAAVGAGGRAARPARGSDADAAQLSSAARLGG